MPTIIQILPALSVCADVSDVVLEAAPSAASTEPTTRAHAHFPLGGGCLVRAMAMGTENEVEVPNTDTATLHAAVASFVGGHMGSNWSVSDQGPIKLNSRWNRIAQQWVPIESGGSIGFQMVFNNAPVVSRTDGC